MAGLDGVAGRVENRIALLGDQRAGDVQLEVAGSRIGDAAAGPDDEQPVAFDRHVGLEAGDLERPLADVELEPSGTAPVPSSPSVGPERVHDLQLEVVLGRPGLLEADGVDVGDVVGHDGLAGHRAR